MNKSYWLRLSQIFWFGPACYQLCLLPFCLLNIQGMIGPILGTIVGLLCVVYFENKIAKIIAWICVGALLAILPVVIYADLLSEVSIMSCMIPTFRIAVLIDILEMLLVPLFLIYHQQIMAFKRGKIVSLIFIVLTIGGSIYSSAWTYVMQDRLVCEKYREGKRLVTKIEDFKDKHGNFPNTLSELGERTEWIYELSYDGTKYTIMDFFEHWHDRCYVGYATYSVETLSYDSGMRKWIHDRP